MTAAGITERPPWQDTDGTVKARQDFAKGFIKHSALKVQQDTAKGWPGTMKEQLETVAMTVTQEHINQYAELTQDFNPLHVDPGFAAGTPMGRTIAHGTMSLNLIWLALARSLDKDSLGRVDLDIRFAKPVFAGTTLEAGGRLEKGSASGCYEVWVNGPDGTAVITGTATVAAASEG